MKKNLLFYTIVAVSFAVLTLSSCSTGTNTPSSNVETSKMTEIYESYRTNSLENGLEPMDYETWLASIRGQDGKDGHSPVITIGENGNWFVDGVDTNVKAQGQQGIQGEKGDTGETGQNGSSVLTGNGIPDENIGVNGDSYIDLVSWDYYLKSDNQWTLVGNIRGTDGQNGNPGKSAYDLYVERFPGYIWGEDQWVLDLASNSLVITLSFDSLGGSDFDDIKCYKGQEINVSYIPEKQHAQFAGWFEDQTMNTEIKYSFIAEESKVFYAKYIYEGTSILFMDKDAIFCICETTFYSKLEKPEVDPIADIGYKFVGWKKQGETELLSFDQCLIESEMIIESVYDYDFLEIPAVFIDTDDGEDIVSKEIYKHSKISIRNTESDYEFENVGADVKGRGNSSWSLAKKPYRIKFDKKRSLFGSSYQSKSWTLIANHSDKSLSRNFIAYELGKRFDGIAFSSAHVFVDLYINGNYNGVYLLCDHIQVGKGKVDIDESISPDGNNGFLLELDMRAKDEGIQNQDWFVFEKYFYAVKSPDTESELFIENKQTQLTYIHTYLTNSYNSITETATLEEMGEYIDLDSFAESYIVDELFANNDCGYSSCYFYKDKDGLLCKGPLWDFDIGAGNVNYNMGSNTECLPDSYLWAKPNNMWYAKLLENENFVNLVKSKIIAYESTIKEVIGLLDISNNSSLYSQYKMALLRNFDKWKILGTYVWPEPKSVYKLATLEEQFGYVYNWLETRWNFIKEQYEISSQEPTIDAYKASFDCDDGVESITVFETSNYDGPSYNGFTAYSRDSSSGEYLKDGSGQINFKINLKDGYEIESIVINGTYKNLKGPDDTLNNNTYRITKISTDLTVQITTRLIN